MKKLFIKPVQGKEYQSIEETRKLLGVIDKSDEHYIINGIMNILHKMNETFYIITKKKEHYVYGYASDNIGVKIIFNNYDNSDTEKKLFNSNVEMSLYPASDDGSDLIISLESNNPEGISKLEEFRNFCLQKFFIYED
ncbi:hypothetical protein CPAST_c10590 [Clostridium pasteurianum DSM 525 = ATCC 6013]|uniref:Uncharacterized protein n=1 Tax=Clostridium pasteurianum DSM 525 = ATCC 6013 TaxID=1262449 RepID=A0A0H3J1B8_CLOPA|nr:hypothetical protein [Clostridium pasteurianum]AJA47159.1 hypothetical protein CPAST_c10590 [Clostridium pasteurianum DSM 525 = ATCC 6013]AJA51147.1 hypothetical protein CLPA_c10590 [Clostridium pasteurianum DSM 525 = ATCC 6013]AOZ74517.1 hypothetical protein AQ983_05125 [Clostridium pasteurianum DSM 525 = ATCC 6013]AOZ78314.1 hypothetical protein AQ984_05115 [Clostridium pasteurianum]ELP59454.1 hypothetical protein F502_09233 [Clostridium pasteurianum DSM 525 = ATCC 6013]